MSTKLNAELTEIVFILDRSDSMSSIARQTIEGFNRFLADQQALPGRARLTLVLFDDRYELPVRASQRSISRKSSAVRLRAMGVASEEVLRDACMSISERLQEEDAKERNKEQSK